MPTSDKDTPKLLLEKVKLAPEIGKLKNRCSYPQGFDKIPTLSSKTKLLCKRGCQTLENLAQIPYNLSIKPEE